MFQLYIIYVIKNKEDDKSWKELKEIIIDRIDDLMPTIRFKNTYDEVIRLLFKLSELHNGKKECKKIVNNIKKSQPNNITLLRELLYFQKTAYWHYIK